ncbi:MAG: DUF6056 family protein [Eubacteriales bacterium]|nr:DUF6056 family protein [Eubacteriales bacterium]
MLINDKNELQKSKSINFNLQNFETNKYIFLLINIIFFTYFLITIFHTPNSEDDFWYMNIFPTKERIHNIKDVIISMINHYNLWGGRVISHGLLSTLLIFDKSIFNILNSLIISSYALFIHYISKEKSQKVNNYILLMTYILLFKFSNGINRENFFWETGSVIYLWTSIPLIILLYSYLKSFLRNKSLISNDNNIYKYIKIIFFAIFSFVLGTFLETISASIIFSIFVIIALKKYLKKKIYNIDIIIFVFMSLGYIFMMISPGNFARNNVSYDPFINYNILVNILFRIHRCTFYLLNNYGIYIALVLALLIVFYKEHKNEEKIKIALFFIIPILASNYILIFTKLFTYRVLTLTFLIIILQLALLASFFNNKNKIFYRILILLITISTLVDMSGILYRMFK